MKPLLCVCACVTVCDSMCSSLPSSCNFRPLLAPCRFLCFCNQASTRLAFAPQNRQRLILSLFRFIRPDLLLMDPALQVTFENAEKSEGPGAHVAFRPFLRIFFLSDVTRCLLEVYFSTRAFPFSIFRSSRRASSDLHKCTSCVLPKKKHLLLNASKLKTVMLISIVPRVHYSVRLIRVIFRFPIPPCPLPPLPCSVEKISH